MPGAELSTRFGQIGVPRGPRSIFSAEGTPWKVWWLWGIPVAWITSALVLFAEEARVVGLHGWGNFIDAAKVAVFLFWCGLAWKRSRVRGRSIVIWLTMLTLPVQGLAAIGMDLRGPAHYHGAATALTDDGTRHAHGHVEHHFHTHDQGAIEVGDDDHPHKTQTADTSKSSSLSGFDTLAPASIQAIVQPLFGAVALGDVKEAKRPFPGRLERPPACAAIPRFR